MNIFISQPMRGLTQEEIQEARENIEVLLIEKYPEGKILDSYFKDYKGNAIQFLAKSIDLLATADIAVFAPNWEHNSGCVIEHEVAIRYGVPVLYLS